MSEDSDEEISLFEYLEETNPNNIISILCRHWSSQNFINHCLHQRVAKNINLEDSHKTKISALSIPLVERLSLPSANFSGEWDKEMIDDIHVIVGSKMFQASDAQAQNAISFIKDSNVSVLALVSQQNQKLFVTEKKFVNLYILLGFLIEKTLKEFSDKGRVAETTEIVEKLENVIRKLLIDQNIEEVKNEDFIIKMLRQIFKNFLQLIKNRNVSKHTELFKEDLLRFIHSFKSESKLIDQKPSFIIYMKNRLDQTYWFSISLWKHVQNYEEFSSKFLGEDSITFTMEQLTKLHIAITQDVLRFSQDEKNGVKWNIFYVLMAELKLTKEETSKLVIHILMELQSNLEKEANYLDSLKNADFARHKQTAFRLFKSYCFNSVTASVIWGINSSYLSKETKK